MTTDPTTPESRLKTWLEARVREEHRQVFLAFCALRERMRTRWFFEDRPGDRFPHHKEKK